LLKVQKKVRGAKRSQSLLDKQICRGSELDLGRDPEFLRNLLTNPELCWLGGVRLFFKRVFIKRVTVAEWSKEPDWETKILRL